MRIGVLQLNSVLDPAENLPVIEKLIEEGKHQGIEHFFLPECFYSMTDGTCATPYLVKEGNEHFKAIQDIAKKYQVYLLGGTAASEYKEGEVINRMYNFSPEGELLEYYDKIHLFSVDLSKHESKKVINESDVYTPGNRPAQLKVGPMHAGLGICFDLRFPEMFRKYSKLGVNTLFIPAAFTVPTGKAHWHVLLRARAIENQCFVIAPAQWGTHNEKIQTFGHSLIIDPWGEVLADAGEGVSLITADLDFDRQQTIRERLNVPMDGE